MKNFFMRLFYQLISLISLILIWETLANFNLIDISFFPAPHTVIVKVFYLYKNGVYYKEFLPSLIRFLLACLISIPLATVVAILAGSLKLFDRIINPIIAMTYPLPKVAIFPLIMLLFGIGDKSKIVLISIGMFYLVYINVRNGTLKIYQSPFMNIVKIYNISGWNFLYYFLLKGILRDFLIGLKSALGYGLVLVVVSEFTISKNGIGHFIWQSWDQFRIEEMYAAILLLSVSGFMITLILDYLIEFFASQSID